MVQIHTKTESEVNLMSPFDMLVMFFFILVSVKAGMMTIEYWRDRDNDEEI